MEESYENKESIIKFDIDGKSFYIRVIWKLDKTDLFHLKIYDGENSWTGQFSYESALKRRTQLDETEADYCDNVKKGLCGDFDDFSYGFSKNDNDAATFSWKKKFVDGAKLVYGSVLLRRDSTPESKDILLDLLLAENKRFKQEIINSTQKNELLMSDVDNHRIEIDNFIDIKTTMERTIYGKFLLLLNAKKKRIQLLEELLLKSSNNIEDI